MSRLILPFDPDPDEVNTQKIFIGGGFDSCDEVDEPYDDSKDHDPCPVCNPKGKGKHPGWYVGLSSRELCKDCDGSGWV